MSGRTLTTKIGNPLLALAVLATAFPVSAQSMGPTLGCIVEESDKDGRWIASRNVMEATGDPAAMPERYSWTPKEKMHVGPGMTFDWSLDYEHRPERVKDLRAVPESEIVVILHFWFDAQKAGEPLKIPQRSGMHLYRSADPQKDFSFTSTSLTTAMLWTKHNNGNASTRAFMPLDSLLAFGAGMDTLVWNIRTEPNDFGGTFAIAKGILPIEEMRNKAAMIAKLHRSLDRKAAKFRTECHAPLIMVGG